MPGNRANATSFQLGTKASPGNYGLNRGKPDIQHHIRQTLFAALQQVCDDPLVQASVYKGLHHFAMTDPVNYVEWVNRVLGQQIRIDQTVERRIVLTFEAAEPPEGWEPNRLDVDKIVDEPKQETSNET